MANKVKSRVAVISIIVEQDSEIEKLNLILHDYNQYIIGRMGIPYRLAGISIISVAVDAPEDTIAALSGKVGNLHGITSKTAYSNVIREEEVQD